MERQFLSVSEFASVAGLTAKTVYRLVGRGELPARRIGRSIRIPVEALIKF